MPKFKQKTRVIFVKPVDEDDADHIMTYDESNVCALTVQTDKEPAEAEEKKKIFVQAMTNILEREEKMNTKATDEIPSTSHDSIPSTSYAAKPSTSQDVKDVSTDENAGGDTAREEKEKKKKGKKKKEKKSKKAEEKQEEKKEKKDKEKQDTNAVAGKSNEENPESQTNDKETVTIQAVGEAVTPRESGSGKKQKKRKLPCLFGFVASWIAKRKEKRREKKRKAIEARSSPTPVESLVEYEHKQSKGGVAFTVEVDSRPMKKPVLPPIKPRPKKTMKEADDKLRNAKIKREEELEKKKKPSREHERKKAECMWKKSDTEKGFKQKAALTIKCKQYDAEKKRHQLQEQRCSTPKLRAPSTLPPLRDAKRKQQSKNASNALDTRHGFGNHDDVFEF